MAEPKVRFKKDDGSNYPSLLKMTLGDVTYPVSIKNGDAAGLPVYSVNNQKGFIPQSDQFEEREVASIDKTNYRIVGYHQFAYNPSRINVGSIAYLKDDIRVIVSPLYVIFECNDRIDIEYLNYYVRTSAFHNNRKRNTEGSVRDSLSYDGFASVDVMLPCIEEQKKIADFLSSVDKVITASEEEVANLETQKKAVMKKIFSQEVRFKRADGSDFPEWEKKHLDEVVEFLDGMRKPIETGDRVAGPYPYYGASGITDYVEDYIFDEDLILLSEDGANILDRNYRVCFMARGKYWVNNHAHVLRANTDCVNEYICEYLESLDYSRMNSGSAQPKLNQQTCRKIPVKKPCLEEQRLIADFLSDFDEAIAAAKKELELWKELKKGLLQQMFV